MGMGQGMDANAPRTSADFDRDGSMAISQRDNYRAPVNAAVPANAPALNTKPSMEWQQDAQPPLTPAVRSAPPASVEGSPVIKPSVESQLPPPPEDTPFPTFPSLINKTKKEQASVEGSPVIVPSFKEANQKALNALAKPDERPASVEGSPVVQPTVAAPVGRFGAKEVEIPNPLPVGFIRKNEKGEQFQYGPNGSWTRYYPPGSRRR